MNKIIGILALLIVVAATWLTFSLHPVTDKINAWQVGKIGNNKFSSALTIFILALPPLLVLIPVKLLLLKRKKIR